MRRYTEERGEATITAPPTQQQKVTDDKSAALEVANTTTRGASTVYKMMQRNAHVWQRNAQSGRDYLLLLY
jgi:hypothetical protein